MTISSTYTPVRSDYPPGDSPAYRVMCSLQKGFSIGDRILVSFCEPRTDENYAYVVKIPHENETLKEPKIYDKEKFSKKVKRIRYHLNLDKVSNLPTPLQTGNLDEDLVRLNQYLFHDIYDFTFETDEEYARHHPTQDIQYKKKCTESEKNSFNCFGIFENFTKFILIVIIITMVVTAIFCRIFL
jgi:hypothetical protein